MDQHHENLEQRLRSLNLGGPDPALKGRTLQAVQQAMAEAFDPAGWRARLGFWRVEMLLAAGIVFCLVLLPVINTAPRPSATRSSEQDTASFITDDLLDQLDLNGSLKPYVRFRLALSRQSRGAYQRNRYHDTEFNIDTWGL